jgi:hypothetical protein
LSACAGGIALQIDRHVPQCVSSIESFADQRLSTFACMVAIAFTIFGAQSSWALGSLLTPLVPACSLLLLQATLAFLPINEDSDWGKRLAK